MKMLLDAFQSEAGHLLGFDQAPDSLLVHLGQRAIFLARAETLGVTILIDGFEQAIDPAVAQRFFRPHHCKECVLGLYSSCSKPTRFLMPIGGSSPATRAIAFDW